MQVRNIILKSNVYTLKIALQDAAA